MWTSVESPVGPLRVIAHHDAVTAIEFDGPRQSGLPKVSGASSQLGQVVGASSLQEGWARR